MCRSSARAQMAAVRVHPPLFDEGTRAGRRQVANNPEEFALMRQIGVAIVGTGWCGGIRAETCAASALVETAHVAELLHFDAKCLKVARECAAAHVPECPTLKTCHEEWDGVVVWLKRAQAVCLAGFGALLAADKPTAIAKAAEAMKLATELAAMLRRLGVTQ